jgi:hypothetical protein
MIKQNSLQARVSAYTREEAIATDPAVKAAFATLKAYYTAQLAALMEQNLSKTVSGTS